MEESTNVMVTTNNNQWNQISGDIADSVSGLAGHWSWILGGVADREEMAGTWWDVVIDDNLLSIVVVEGVEGTRNSVVLILEYVLFKPEGLAGIWRSIDPEVSLFVGGIWLSN